MSLSLACDNVQFGCIKVPRTLSALSSALRTDAASCYERWYHLQTRTASHTRSGCLNNIPTAHNLMRLNRGPSNLLENGNRVSFQRANFSGRGVDQRQLCNVGVKERVEINSCSLLGPSWPVLSGA
jgi:hypothetical protein